MCNTCAILLAGLQYRGCNTKLASKAVTFRLDPELVELVRARSVACGTSLTRWVAGALRDRLERELRPLEREWAEGEVLKVARSDAAGMSVERNPGVRPFSKSDQARGRR